MGYQIRSLIPLHSNLVFLLWWPRGSKEPYEKASPDAQTFLKPLIVSFGIIILAKASHMTQARVSVGGDNIRTPVLWD